MDDVADNVAAAIALGMHGHLFHDATRLRKRHGHREPTAGRVLGCERACPKGTAHYARISTEHADDAWVRDAVTIGDSPADMRLGAEHGIPVRIGIDRDGDAESLSAAGATHVVRTLTDILPIVTAA